MKDIQADGLSERTAYDIVELESGIKAECVLIDWKGVTEGETEIKYSVSKAKEYLLLSDEFRDFIDEKSDELSNKRSKHKEEAKKK